MVWEYFPIRDIFFRDLFMTPITQLWNISPIPLDTPQTPSDISRHSHDNPDIALTLTNIPDTQQTSSDTLISHRVPPDIPWQLKCLSVWVRLSNERFVEVKAVPGGQRDVFGVPECVLECPEVFWGCWRVYGRLKGMSCSLFPSISFNLRKSQMKSKF